MTQVKQLSEKLSHQTAAEAANTKTLKPGQKAKEDKLRRKEKEARPSKEKSDKKEKIDPKKLI